MKKLRKTHYYQMMDYFDRIENDGAYYGNKDMFWQRHKDLRNWFSVQFTIDKNKKV